MGLKNLKGGGRRRRRDSLLWWIEVLFERGRQDSRYCFKFGGQRQEPGGGRGKDKSFNEKRVFFFFFFLLAILIITKTSSPFRLLRIQLGSQLRSAFIKIHPLSWECRLVSVVVSPLVLRVSWFSHYAPRTPPLCISKAQLNQAVD